MTVLFTADQGGEPPLKKARVDDEENLQKKPEEPAKTVTWENLSEGLTKLEWVCGEDTLTLFMPPRATGKRLKPNTALAYASVSHGMAWTKENEDGLATLYDVHGCFCSSHFLCWKLHVKETKDKFIRCRCNRPESLSCAPP